MKRRKIADEKEIVALISLWNEFAEGWNVREQDKDQRLPSGRDDWSKLLTIADITKSRSSPDFEVKATGRRYRLTLGHKKDAWQQSGIFKGRSFLRRILKRSDVVTVWEYVNGREAALRDAPLVET
jgi:hypothetical protein